LADTLIVLHEYASTGRDTIPLYMKICSTTKYIWYVLKELCTHVLLMYSG